MIKFLRPRLIQGNPRVRFFKPQGVPMCELEEVAICADEFEALRLHDVDGLNQTEAAERMKISQPTFARTLDRTYKKIATAIVEGKAIRIEEVDHILM
jgi:uncharacterized protein